MIDVPFDGTDPGLLRRRAVASWEVDRIRGDLCDLVVTILVGGSDTADKTVVSDFVGALSV